MKTSKAPVGAGASSQGHTGNSLPERQGSATSGVQIGRREQAVSTAPRSLAECEHVIERGRQTFVEVGQALLEIRDRRLYRQTHATFEDYCRERWGFTRQFANAQIAAAGVLDNLGCQTEVGYKQAVALAPLPPEAQRRVAERVDFGTATVAEVREEVAAERGETKDAPKTCPPERRRPIIDPEFCRLLPPLAPEEFAILEDQICKFGCLVPLLATQDNVLLDGHARLQICEKHGVPYTVNIIEVADRQEAIVIILDIQLCRKNLTPDQKIALGAQVGGGAP